MALVHRLIEPWTVRAVHHVRSVLPRQAEGLVAEVYAQIRREFTVAPTFTLHSPLPELLGAVWGACRESLVAGQGLRGEKEIVAVAVSRANACPFCVTAHSLALAALGDPSSAQAAAESGLDASGPRVAALARWASEVPPQPVPSLIARAERPVFAAIVLAFHYINRMVNVLIGALSMETRSRSAH